MTTIHDKINADIARVGQTVIGTSDGVNNFAYTIGLTEVGLPELIVFGARFDYAAWFLNTAAALMKTTGEFKDGDTTDELADGYDLAFKVVTAAQAREHACQALYRYQDMGLTPRFLQLVVPDKAGVMPWEPGYDDSYMGRRQPLLYLR